MDNIEKIVDKLFTNGSGQKADRLVLTVDSTPKRDLGGLCRRAVVDQLRAAAVLPPQKKLRALAARWENSAAQHESRAEMAEGVKDSVNFNRQDTYAYSARLHATQLRETLIGKQTLQELAAAVPPPRREEPAGSIRDAIERVRVECSQHRDNGWVLGAVYALDTLKQRLVNNKGEQ